MTRWGMVIDLQSCIGCNGCAEICRDVNRVPGGGEWREVPIYRKEDNLLAPELALPFSCMQCSDAPCLDVCPTTATLRREDGIIDIEYDLCIGCGYCVVACPYMARHINKHNESLHLPSAVGKPEPFPNGADLHGVCTKCNFCIPRVEAGMARGYEPGVDPQASPTCVAFCTTNALHFGDLSDPDSHVSQLTHANETAQMQLDLNTGPAIYYLLGDGVKTRLPDTPETPLAPRRKQTVWEWPAVLNFILGGTATGLYLIGLLALASGAWETAVFKWLSPLLTSLGFLALTVEAGRPLRSRYLLRHLRRSWMSREALAAAIFIPLALLDWFIPNIVLQSIAAIAAAGLTVSQGFMIYRSPGVASWSVWPMPFLFIASGFAAGGGLALALAGWQVRIIPELLLSITQVSIVLNLAAWLVYLYVPRTSEFQTATASLRTRASMGTIIGIGGVLPLLILIWLAVGSSVDNQILAALAGLSVITGHVTQKAGIVLKAGYLRGITLRMRSQIKFDEETHPQRLDRYPKSKVKNGQALSPNAPGSGRQRGDAK
ncbi:MAG: dimethyl sulfoxide reductase anchor subunit [Chloroflexi bacterium]|nr:dimethyl sulfoxide reductase anchor subunit [Chloroflexota bacterium]